jgi:hypothetical protein
LGNHFIEAEHVCQTDWFFKGMVDFVTTVALLMYQNGLLIEIKFKLKIHLKLLFWSKWQHTLGNIYQRFRFDSADGKLTFFQIDRFAAYSASGYWCRVRHEVNF